jgi:hypothetical protein
MLNLLAAYIYNMFAGFDKPNTYGSALESYIISKNPQDSCDVDRLAREFDHKIAARAQSGWPL